MEGFKYVCIYIYTCYTYWGLFCLYQKYNKTIALVTSWYSFQVGPLLGHWCRLNC